MQSGIPSAFHKGVNQIIATLQDKSSAYYWDQVVLLLFLNFLYLKRMEEWVIYVV